MASHERDGKLALIAAVCLLLIPIHTLPLRAAENSPETRREEIAVPEKAPAEGVQGIASYYAKRFKGRKTTSGSRYRPEKMTAAHPTLPLGTKVKVTNLDNGKEIMVTINDRCRKRKFSFIDLSRAAAEKLGFLGKGTTRVAILPLEQEPS